MNDELLLELRADISQVERQMREVNAIFRRLSDDISEEMQVASRSSNVLGESYREAFAEAAASNDRFSGGLHDTERLLDQVGATGEQSLQEVARQAEQTAESLDNVEEGSSRSNRSFESLGKVGTVAFGAILTGITAAVAALSTMSVMSVKNTQEFEKAKNKIQAMAGVSEKTAEKIAEAGKRAYLNGWGESMEEVGQISAVLARNLGDSMIGMEDQIIEKTLMMSKTFDLSGEEIARALSSMSQNFKGESLDTQLDNLTYALQNTKGDVGEVVDSFWEYANSAAQVGYSSETFARTLAKGSESGAFSIDKLGDAIKEFSIRAIDGSDDTKESFAALGLNVDKTTKALANGGKNATKSMNDVIKSLQKVKDSRKREELGVKLFGTMWEDLGEEAVFALAQTNRSFSTFTTNTEKGKNALSVFETQISKSSKANTDLFKKLGISQKEMTTIIAEGGEKSAETFNKLLKKIDGIKDPIERNKVGVQLFGKEFTTFGTTATEALSIVDGDLSEMDRALQKAGDAVNKDLGSQWEIFKRNLMSPFTDDQSPIYQFLVKLVDYLNNNLPRAFDKVSEVSIKMKNFFESVKESDKTMTILNQGSEILATTFEVIKDIIDIITPLFLKFSLVVLKLADAFSPLVKIALYTGKLFEQLVKLLWGVVKAIGNSLEALFVDLTKWVDLTASMFDHMTKIFTKIAKGDFIGAERERKNMFKNLEKSQKESNERTEKLHKENAEIMKSINFDTWGTIQKDVNDAMVVYDKSVEKGLQGVTKAIEAVDKEQPSKMMTDFASDMTKSFSSTLNLDKETEKEMKKIPSIISINKTSSTEEMTKLGSIMRGSFTTGLKPIEGDVKTSLSLLDQIVFQKQPTSGTLFYNFGSNLKTKLSSGLSGTGSIGTKSVVELSSGLNSKEANEKSLEQILKFNNRVKSNLNIKSSMKPIGTDIAKGIGEGFVQKEAYNHVTTKSKTLSEKIKDLFKKNFNINSPSKWARDVIGVGIGEGLGVGLVKSEKYAVAGAEALIDSTQKSLSTLSIPLLDKSNIEQSLQAIKGASKKAFSVEENKNAVIKVEVKGNLSPLVEEVEVNIANAIKNKIGGRLF